MQMPWETIFEYANIYAMICWLVLLFAPKREQVLPLLFMGSLITESFFGIPGLGSYTIDAIQAQDFAVVRAMVFLGSFLYIIGLILTDISYSWVDPRVRLQ